MEQALVTPPAVVLVVDDHEDLRNSIAHALSAEGYEVLTAPGGAAALAMIPVYRPHLVLLDVNMPGVDGFDVLETLRTHEDGMPKVVMVTAAPDEHLRARALRLGACDYFVKGDFDLQMLLDCIARHVAA